MTAGLRFERDVWELVAAWSGEAVVVRRDEAADAWVFVALHDDTLGVPVGGCRMTEYDVPAAGLRDALRLAEGMTWKWASIGLPFGGGKSVLALSRPLDPEERVGLLRRFGRLLETLRGAYRTGEDLGTTPEDMAIVARETEHVMGAHGGATPMDPGPFTALGVLQGIREAAAARLGREDLEGSTVLIQGVGDVGEPLARLLAAEGVDLLLSDLDGSRVRALAAELGARTVPPAEIYDTACDVFAPCARGGVLSGKTIPRLRCRIVAGSANNQLAAPEDARGLHERGILYAPDYVVNAGGAVAFGHLSLGRTDPDELRERVLELGPSIRRIFEEAEEEGILPTEAARRRAERTLREGADARRGARG